MRYTIEQLTGGVVIVRDVRDLRADFSIVVAVE